MPNRAFWILDGSDKLGDIPEDPVGATLYKEEEEAPTVANPPC
ncbi:hypothetical protein [Streptomyces scabiei]|nr:hypothetical protein [Streptomyces scabiei]MDX2835006.1 hypothetical protein [Streptomyces scabiei]MDX3679944.1 hypothetical protein [Streptomyces scabiei]